MVNTLPQRGVLRVVPPAQLEAQIKAQDEKKAAADTQALSETALVNLAAHIRTQYDMFSNHRNDASAGWSERLLVALRAFNGQYDADKLGKIRQFGGSEVYARIVAMKCRGASSLLRDVYLTPDKPWGVTPPTDPDVPASVMENVQKLVMGEVANLQRAGQPIDPDMIRDRVMQLHEASRQAEKKQGMKRARLAEDKIEELLDEGGFYKALSEFLVDLPLFPIACIKGPVVKIVPTVAWGTTGQPTIEQQPRLIWYRVSPFDLYMTPGASDVDDAEIIERLRFSRSDLNDMLDLPGFDVEAVRAVLEEYGAGGLVDNWDTTDSERAAQESRENPRFNRSGMIACLEYHGSVQGKLLIEYGMTKEQIPDELRDYSIQAWLIGRHVVKCQFSPSPRKRHPYFITSFEKVPGTPIGNGLPDILADVADVCNATLRALVNNLSIASGPQVVVNVDRLADGEDVENMHPWKRWHMKSDPMGNNSQEPVSFFMPESNAQQLLQVYKEFNNIADELSAIPKYQTGGGASGGAGRTASGLAMLMTNASKILQTVAANVDRDVMGPALLQLYDMMMLTDTSGVLRGDEAITIMGVNVAVQRETQRSRQLEFLQITGNPLDMQILGPRGRATVLRKVAGDIGLPGEEIVPSEDKLEQMEQQQQQQQQQMQQAAAAAQGNQPGKTSTNDMGPRTNIAGGSG